MIYQEPTIYKGGYGGNIGNWVNYNSSDFFTKTEFVLQDYTTVSIDEQLKLANIRFLMEVSLTDFYRNLFTAKTDEIKNFAPYAALEQNVVTQNSNALGCVLRIGPTLTVSAKKDTGTIQGWLNWVVTYSIK